MKIFINEWINKKRIKKEIFNGKDFCIEDNEGNKYIIEDSIEDKGFNICKINSLDNIINIRPKVFNSIDIL